MERKRIDVLLVERGLFDSRAKACAAIAAGLVTAGGRTVAKPSESVAADTAVTAQAAHPWVGRGALKLLHALEQWPIALEGRTVLDVGASTGGFTEVCLSRGAARVYAVDVGRDQLHPRLRQDPRVADLSATDVRRLDAATVPTPPDVIVCDVSFIGLAKALPAALALAAPDANLVALVKPQFEVGPDKVGKGGLVKDETARALAMAGVVDWLEQAGWLVRASTDSPVAGGDGNREFLLWAQKP